MLQYLKIKNFAIIENAEVHFKKGMTAITGETGAGKSILIHALSVALGLRIDASLVNTKTTAEISAIFNIKDLPDAQQFLQDNGLSDDKNCIVRRVIYKEGKNRAFINDTPVTLAKLKLLGQHLVNFYGQHDHYDLLDANKQLTLLDTYGGYSKALQAVQKTYDTIKQIEKKIVLETERLIQKNTEISLLQYQYTELNDINPTKNEFEQLDKSHRQLSNAENKQAALHEILTCVYENDSNLITTVDRLKALIDTNDSDYKNLGDSFEQITIYLQEAYQEARKLSDTIEINQAKLTDIEQRLSQLHDIARKHQINPNDLFAHLESIKKNLTQFDTDSNALTQLKAKKDALMNNYQQQALQLRTARKKAAKTFALEIQQYLKQLNIAQGEFYIYLTSLTHITENGIDRCEFTVTFNKGQQPFALKKVASGGELSRIALAVHVILSQKIAPPTLIFDEVDVGISGGTAEIVGQMLKKLAQCTQLLCITHQAQVAAQGDQNLHVYKKNMENKTISVVNELTTNERIKAIAQIIGGIKITEQTLIHAKEMVQLG